MANPGVTTLLNSNADRGWLVAPRHHHRRHHQATRATVRQCCEVNGIAIPYCANTHQPARSEMRHARALIQAVIVSATVALFDQIQEGLRNTETMASMLTIE